MLGVIISGIVSGLLYAITGLGLMVTYRATRVINFALGGVGAVAGYCVLELLSHSWPYWIAVVVAIGVAALLGLLLNYLVAKPLRNADPITVALGTMGALLVLEGLLGQHYGFTVKALRAPFSDQDHTITLAGVTLGLNQGFILVVGVVLAVAVWFFFQRTNAGLEMRSVSIGPATSSLLGVNVAGVQALSWAIGSGMGAIAAILVIPQTYLSPTGFTSYVVSALVAVVLGGFTSVSGVVVGAVAFSVVLNLFQAYVASGYPNTFALVGVGLVLFFRPYGVFGSQDREVNEPHFPRRSALDLRALSGLRRRARGALSAPAARNVALWVGGERADWSRYLVLLLGLCVLPFLVSDNEVLLLADSLVMFLSVLGLNVVSGYLGRVSLGQSAFMAVGGYTVAAVMLHSGLGVWLGLVVALLVGAVVGAIVSLPIMRLSELYFVLLTILLSAAVPELITRMQRFTGGTNGLQLISPDFLFDSRNQYWLALAIAAVIGGLVFAAQYTRIGRGWRAARDSEPAARALGIDVRLVRLAAFALGSGLAALGGGLSAVYTGWVGPDSYGIFPSLYLLLAVVIGGRASVGGSLLGAFFVTLVPHHAASSPIPPDVIFGVVLALILVVSPGGLAGILRSIRSLAVTPEAVLSTYAEGISAAVTREPRLRPGKMEPAPRHGAGTGGRLELDGVVAGYGRGLVLHGIDLTVEAGEIVTLLGPNGAGKSTVIRTISGLIPLSGGEIRWRGVAGDLSKPHLVTRGGICQVPEGRAIFPDLTVAENLTMGQSGLGKRRSGSVEETLERVLGHFPRLRERYRQNGGSLSGGEQQMLAIGRALMSQPQMLLLDEPSLGLAPIVTQQLFEILDGIRREGTSILLVEQNAQAALSVSDRAYVLNAGRIQLSGTADGIRNDEQLAAAYLGGAV